MPNSAFCNKLLRLSLTLHSIQNAPHCQRPTQCLHPSLEPQSIRTSCFLCVLSSKCFALVFDIRTKLVEHDGMSGATFFPSEYIDTADMPMLLILPIR